MAEVLDAQSPEVSASTRIGKNPNKIRRSTICIGLIRTAAHFMKMKLLPQIRPRAANARLVDLFISCTSSNQLTTSTKGFPFSTM